MAKSTQHRRRRHGEGSVYPTPTGWRGAYITPDPVSGRPVRRYVSGKTERDVIAKLAAARAQLARGEPVGGTPTLAAWSRRWLIATRLRVRPSTWQGYSNNLERHVLPRLGHIELQNLRPSDVEDLMASLVASGGLAPSTVGLVRIALGACLADAVRDGVISRNVARLARPPRVPRRERQALDPTGLLALFRALEADPLGPSIVLLGTTGLRRGELLGLQWHDADRQAGTLTVRRQLARHADGYGYTEPKGDRSYRTIALPARALAALDHLAGGDIWPSDARPVVATGPDRDRPWHPVAYASAFKDATTKAGHPQLRVHDLRHAAVSIALAAGVPPRDVAESAGHAPAVLMRTYAHVMPGSRNRVAAAMDQALDGA